MTLSTSKRRFLDWLQRVSVRRLALKSEGAVRSGSVLLRIEVSENGRAIVQLKEPHSPRAYAADWPAVVGGSVEVRSPEAMGKLFEEVWHALHERANGWEMDPDARG